MNNYDETENELVNRLRSGGLQGDKPDISDLMYQCGFAAGQQQSRSKQIASSVRMLAAAAALVLVGFIVGRWDTGSPQIKQSEIALPSSTSDRYWMRLDLPSNQTKEAERLSSLFALRSTQAESDASSKSTMPNRSREEALTASGYFRQTNPMEMN